MRKEDFDNLLASVREAGEIKRGEVKPARTTHVSRLDVPAIRRKLRKSQTAFARMIGVSLSTLQDWEQGRREPSAAAKTLIKVAELNPGVLRKIAA